MIESYSVIGVACAALLCVTSFYLLRAGRLSSGSFVLWLLISLALGLVSGVSVVFDVFHDIFGTQLFLSSVVAVAFLSLLALILYMNVKFDALESRLLKMTAELTAVKYSSKPRKEEDTQMKPPEA